MLCVPKSARWAKSVTKEVLASIIQGSGLGPKLAKNSGNTTNHTVRRKPEDKATEYKFQVRRRQKVIDCVLEAGAERQDAGRHPGHAGYNDWDMGLNTNKVHVMHFGLGNMNQKSRRSHVNLT